MSDLVDHDTSPDSPSAEVERLRAQRLAAAERQSFLSLLPRRELWKAAVLVLFLVVIVALQRRSGSIVQRLGEGLFGPPPPARVAPKEPPRVRMAPLSPPANTP